MFAPATVSDSSSTPGGVYDAMAESDDVTRRADGRRHASAELFGPSGFCLDFISLRILDGVAMHDREWYQKILGLKSPWTVSKVKLNSEERQADVFVGHPSGTMF